MHSAHLGKISLDPKGDWLVSQPTQIDHMGNDPVTFFFEELEDGEGDIPSEYDAAVGNFLALPSNWRDELRPYLWDYYNDVASQLEDDEYDAIDPSSDILDHIRIGSDPVVGYDYDENDIYISLEGGCDWETEHGLQITLRNGNKIAKVGSYDGHVTNADAYDRPEFQDVVYVKQSDL